MKRTQYLLAAALTGICACSTEPPPAPEPPKPEMELLELRSTPAGALAKASTGGSCTTPCSLEKESRESFSVTFEKDGYKSQTVQVTNNLEMLKKFNAKKDPTNADLIDLPSVHLTPNPVSVVLQPAWSKP